MLHATLYVTTEHKMSCSGCAIETIVHRDIHNGCSTVLTEFRSVIVWLFLSAAECSGVLLAFRWGKFSESVLMNSLV
jgi:hypothetical protein